MTGSAVPDGDDSDPRARERVGSVLDEKWTLERVLGSGGMATVYAARHRNGARGAVKILHPELARRVDVRERFLREGYAANRVEHRGAVQVLDDDVIKEGPDEGTAYLVMEILEGQSLEERIERGPPIHEPELLQMLNDVLAVLEAAHEHGVVHRDLKPANLFLNKDPSGHGVKVLDFGLARLAEVRSVTGVGLAVGTPSFMAPEQANGRSAEIDARTDIFALGATAFMILSNRGVHEANGVLELVARMGTLPAPKLREVAPHVSEGVAGIVDRALEFKREDRYPSAAAMRADVVAVLAALGNAHAPTAAPASGSPGPVSVPIAAIALPAASQKTRADAPASKRQALRDTAPSRSSAWPVLALLVAAGVALVVFVPRVRERSGVDSALGQIMGAGSQAASGSEAAPSASAPSPTAREGASGGAGSDLVAAVPELVTDAASDAAPEVDAGTDASADDEEEDDDLDASDVAAIMVHDAAQPATTQHSIAKRPRQAPGVKHGKPRKPRRPRRR